MSIRSATFERIIKSEPTLLVHDGHYLDTAPRTRAEVDAALRSQGKAAIGGIQSVVLETDGTLTVIPGSAR